MIQSYTTCPHCQNPMEPRDRHGVAIDFCPNCRGVWLDRGELDTIIQRSGRFLEFRGDRPREQRDKRNGHHEARFGVDSFEWF